MGYQSWEQLLASDAVDLSVTNRVRLLGLCLLLMKLTNDSPSKRPSPPE